MSFQKLTSVLAVLVIGIVGLLAFFPTTKAITHATSSCSWNIVSSPNAGVDDMLYGVAALSPQDIWAVGKEEPSNGVPYQTLIEHWNGTNWSIVSGPMGMYSSTLYGVVALSPNDVWAVGNDIPTSTSVGQTLVEHWNGANWAIIPSPNNKTGDNSLKAITAVPGSNELWAVGTGSNATGFQTLIEYWDGKSWSVVPGVNLGTPDNLLNGVTAFSASDVWAVGTFNATSSHAAQVLIEHWNGTTWSSVPSGRKQGGLNSVTPIPGTTHLWAVGMLTLSDGSEDPLTERWDGSAWRYAQSPAFSGTNTLSGVAAIAPSNVEAVGYSSQVTGLMLHRYGGRWNVDTPQTPGTQSAVIFYAITVALPSKQLWAVGGYSVPGKLYQTLVEVHC